MERLILFANQAVKTLEDRDVVLNQDKMGIRYTSSRVPTEGP